MDTQEILARLHITQLTPMQKAVGENYANSDLIILSPTGSGKTLAVLLPLVNSLCPDVQGVQAIILEPSRELALQVDEVFKSMKTSFVSMSCYGGRATMEEHQTMKRINPSVIVATPGRMNDHLRKQNLDARTVVTLIIDEFDKCLELGFQDEMRAVIEQLPSLKKRVLLSATDMAEIPQFVGIGNVAMHTSSAVKLNYLAAKAETSRLNLFCVLSSEKDKLETLYRLLCFLGNSSTIVFANYRESVDRVTTYLKHRMLCCEPFHGGMKQSARERSLYKFRHGSCLTLVSTDLASRGLDIPNIDNIVHYHLPVNQEVFVHRNGRTARWKALGTSYLILHSEERLPDYISNDPVWFIIPDQVPKPVKPYWTTLYMGKGKKDKLSKADIVGFLYKKGGLLHGEIGQVDLGAHNAFVTVRRDKAKQVLMLVRGEKIKGVKVLIEEAK